MPTYSLLLLPILPPTPPSSPFSPFGGSLDPNCFFLPIPRDGGAVLNSSLKLQDPDVTLLLRSGRCEGAGGLDTAEGGLLRGKLVECASCIFRETSFNLRTSATVCYIFSPGFYLKLTKDIGRPLPDSVTYLSIIEQTSVRILSQSGVSLNRKYASALIIADRLSNSPADSVRNTAPC